MAWSISIRSRRSRALILMKPRRVIEALFGSCPDGYLGLLARLGCDPQYGKETYRAAFDLFADPRNRRRAKVLGQLPGRITADTGSVCTAAS